MLIKIVSAVISFFITVITGMGNSIDSSKTKKAIMKDELVKNITSSAEARIGSGQLTGAHITVMQDNEELINMTFGKNAEGGDALASDAVYRIASMTKPVTAAALLIEYQRGHLDIYADVADYLPEYADMKVAVEIDGDGNVLRTEPAKERIKVYQLVSHTSGITCNNEGNLAWSKYLSEHREGLTMEEMVKYYATLPLSFNPGTAQSYSTGAFDVAAQIISDVSGMDYAEYLKKNIFEPLGMNDTTFTPSEEQFDRMVAIHARNEDGSAYNAPVQGGCVFGNVPVTYYAAGGGLASTAADYVRFAQMLLNGGTAPDGTVILNEDMVKLMATPVPEMAKGIMGGGVQWGLGVTVNVGNNETLPKGTFGWSGAYGTHFWVDPSNRITAVYMKNSSYDGGAGCMTIREFEKDVADSMVLAFLIKDKKG